MVGDLAEVSINDRAIGILWKSPYQLDVTDALKPGVNQLQIKVTNEWTNRIIGDRAAQEGKKVLSVVPAGGIFRGPQTLTDSGLLGPVKFLSVKKVSTTTR
jgi:(4-O-methyl)-D-glucuronate---lignin esterase